MRLTSPICGNYLVALFLAGYSQPTLSQIQGAGEWQCCGITLNYQELGFGKNQILEM